MKDSTRTSVIGAVKNRLTFYTAALIILEGILIVLAYRATGVSQVLLVCGMVVVVALPIVAVWATDKPRQTATLPQLAPGGFVYASPDREHSQFPKTYWDNAQTNISIFAPTLWHSIMGLTAKKSGKEIDSMCKAGMQLHGKMRILLMSPDSASFRVHLDLLATARGIPDLDKDKYVEHLKIFEQLMHTANVAVRYHMYYPTVSFVIVDDSRVKVDYILPHCGIAERPLVEFTKGDGSAPTVFEPFFKTFEEVWNDPTTTPAPFTKTFSNKAAV